MANSEENAGFTGASEACDEAETALKLFLQGRFDEAETYVQENAQRREKVTGAIPIFTHCHAVILFAKAGITGTGEDRKQASDRLSEASAMAREHAPSQGWAKSIAAWGMSYFSSPSPRADNISEEELTCRIIEAEATYLLALLCFFEESMASFFRAALLIRKAIQGYKHCHTILQRQCHASRSKHDVGAVQLGFGGFSLAISMLPPKLLRLLSVLGFPSNRDAGLHAVNQSLIGGGLRSSVAGVLLLSYHVILPAFFSIPQEREQHVLSAERVLTMLQTLFPDSFFLSFYRGRLQRLKGDLEGAIEWFTKLDEGLRLEPNSKFFKVRHAWVYELGLSHMMQLQWEAAEKYWAELEKDSVWSTAFFAYIHGASLCMHGETEAAAENFAKVKGLIRGTISGRVLAEEQYASRKVKDHSLDTEEGTKSIQGRLSGIEFLYLWNSFPQMSQDKLEEIVQIIVDAEALLVSANESIRSDERDTIGTPKKVPTEQEAFLEEYEDGDDDLALCLLMKGTALRELQKMEEALECLEQLREETCYVETELFIIPMAAYERAVLFINQYTRFATENPELASDYSLLVQAGKELSIAEAFKSDYNFLWRLLGRVHAARGAIRVLMGGEVNLVDGGSTEDIASAECQWIDSEEYDLSLPRQSMEKIRPELRVQVQNSINDESEDSEVFFDAS
ncbi:unnamed protein product [Calypogeia fissa]